MQAEMEAQQMKIADAKRAQEEAARVKLITDRFYNTQKYGGAVPGSIAAANYKSTLTPEQQMLNEVDPVGQAKSEIATQSALAAEQRKFKHEASMERIKANAKAGEKGILSAKDKLQLGDDQYNQFRKDNADNLGRMEGYRGLEAVYKDPSGTSAFQSISKSGQAVIDGQVFQASNQGARDMALIFSVMKMLDPGSTVREGEFALAANASGQARAAMNIVKQMWSGDQLPAEARQQLMSLARGQYDEARSAVSQNLTAAKARMKTRMPSLNVDVEYQGLLPDYTPAFGAAAFDPTIIGSQQGGNPPVIAVVPQGKIPNDLVPKAR
jgi:hypothetical protein